MEKELIKCTEELDLGIEEKGGFKDILQVICLTCWVDSDGGVAFIKRRIIGFKVLERVEIMSFRFQTWHNQDSYLPSNWRLELEFGSGSQIFWACGPLSTHSKLLDIRGTNGKMALAELSYQIGEPFLLHECLSIDTTADISLCWLSLHAFNPSGVLTWLGILRWISSISEGGDLVDPVCSCVPGVRDQPSNLCCDPPGP